MQGRERDLRRISAKRVGSSELRLWLVSNGILEFTMQNAGGEEIAAWKANPLFYPWKYRELLSRRIKCRGQQTKTRQTERGEKETNRKREREVGDRHTSVCL